MTRFMAVAALALLLSGAAGCRNTSSVIAYPPDAEQFSSSGRAVSANLRGRNWGVYLFYFIPVWSGNPDRPNQRDYHVGVNELTRGDTERMLARYAKRMKRGELEDIRFVEDSTGVFGLWILWRRSIEATAVTVSDK